MKLGAVLVACLVSAVAGSRHYGGKDPRCSAEALEQSEKKTGVSEPLWHLHALIFEMAAELRGRHRLRPLDVVTHIFACLGAAVKLRCGDSRHVLRGWPDAPR